MKLSFLASVTVLALAYATPGVAAAAPDSCEAGKDPSLCSAASEHAAPVKRKHTAHLLAARAAHYAHFRAHAHAKVAVHASPAPESEPIRVAALDSRHAALSCEGASASVLCPGYLLMGFAY